MRTTLGQLLRYGIVGVLLNGLGYLLYLALTYSGMGPKLTMTLLFVIGVSLSFLFNKRWSFDHRGDGTEAMLRYSIAYLMGYLVNLSALYYLVDILDWPHQAVQACMIVIVAGLLFLLQKCWVFRSRAAET